jgi:hypothetical protein
MTTSRPVTPPTALDLLSTLAPRPPRRRPAETRPRVATWCERCGAPRNLGRRDCPGCALLAESRERIVTYLARHGMPPGGPVELARLADVPLRAVGDMMVEGRAGRR